MKSHRNPSKRLPKPSLVDNFGLTIRLLYDDLVEAEALAITADEAATSLPVPSLTGKHKRTLSRLFTLVRQTSGSVSAARERGEELVAQHDARVASQFTKRSPARRAR